MNYPELVPLFFLVALIYASAGFGGGSSYLAIMALWGISPETMRPTALLCNLVVVSGGTWIFWKNNFLDLKKALPFVLASVPMAFLGGYFLVNEKTFFILLGASLTVAGLLIFFQNYFSKNAQPVDNQPIASKPITNNQSTNQPIIGGATGLLSGMVGIGGGIFLSPILHLLRFDAPKKIAAIASFFILVNSLAGLAGNFAKNLQPDWAMTLPLLFAVLVGGQIGSRWSAFRMPQNWVRLATALVVFYAGVSILMKNL